jgi:hypothetical protein
MTRRKTLKKNKPFWPPKYYRGLTKRKALQRHKEIEKRKVLPWTELKAYRPFKTNIGIKTRKSSYTADWHRLFPEAKSLSEKAEATGVPEKFIRASYDRGMAAWRTGHRPGATSHQWGYARAHSFLLCGKTHYSTDSDLVRKAKKQSKSARKWFKRCETRKLTRI